MKKYFKNSSEMTEEEKNIPCNWSYMLTSDFLTIIEKKYGEMFSEKDRDEICKKGFGLVSTIIKDKNGNKINLNDLLIESMEFKKS